MQGEIRYGLNEEFKTRALEKMITVAAKEATTTGAEPLIRNEVARIVKERVAADHDFIQRAVAEQSRASVNRINDQLDSMVRASVEDKVSTAVNPVSRQLTALKDSADLRSLIDRMRSGDGVAFDKLDSINLQHLPKEERELVAEAVSQTKYDHVGGGFLSPQGYSEAKAISHLSDDDPLSRQGAIDTLSEIQDLKLLYRLVAIALSDPSLNVRASAFRAINGWSKGNIPMLDSRALSAWWSSNKAKYIK